MSEQKTLVEVKHLQQYFPAGGMGRNKRYVQIGRASCRERV